MLNLPRLVVLAAVSSVAATLIASSPSSAQAVDISKCSKTSTFTGYKPPVLLSLKMRTSMSFDPNMPKTATTLGGVVLRGTETNIPAGVRLSTITPLDVGGFGATVVAGSNALTFFDNPQFTDIPGVKHIEVYYRGDNTHQACSLQTDITYTRSPVISTVTSNGATSVTVKVGQDVPLKALVTAPELGSHNPAYQFLGSHSNYQHAYYFPYQFRSDAPPASGYVQNPSGLNRDPADWTAPPIATASFHPLRTGTIHITGLYAEMPTSCCTEIASNPITIHVVP